MNLFKMINVYYSEDCIYNFQKSQTKEFQILCKTTGVRRLVDIDYNISSTTISNKQYFFP